MPTPVTITYDALESALEWSSSGAPYENEALIHRKSGEVFLRSMEREFESELPDDIDDEAIYVAMPHRNDLDLGRELVFKFTESEVPHLLNAVEACFRQRGAYSKFKSVLERNDCLQRWYDFEAAATRVALLEWASENGFVVQ